MKSTQPDQDSCDTRNRPCLCEASVDCRETRLARYDGFARAFPPDGGRSGHNYQILRADHEHQQHHHQCVFSLVAAVVSVLPLFFQQHPFPSPSPEQPCLHFCASFGLLELHNCLQHIWCIWIHCSSCLGISDTPEDQEIYLFDGLLANPDMPLSQYL